MRIVNETKLDLLQMAILAAGHPGAQQANGLFIKPTTQQEVDFYQFLVSKSSELVDFVPTFMGTLVEQSKEQEKQTLVVLEDLCAGFNEPNVIDIKLGSILYDENADLAKQERMKKVSEETTSGSLGFRIAGANLYDFETKQRVHHEKQFGRSAKAENVEEYLKTCFTYLDSNDYIYSVLINAISQLEELYEVLSDSLVEMRSASILIIYEGDIASMESKAEALNKIAELDPPELEEPEPKLVDVRLIDFAHSKKSKTIDRDTLNGLNNLIKRLKRVAK